MKPSITVVSLGSGDPRFFTRQAESVLRKAKHLILRTGRSRAAAFLEDAGIAYDTLDGFYDRFDDFDEMHRQMAIHLWEEAAKYPLVFAVQDALTDGAVSMLRVLIPDDASLAVEPGVCASEIALAAVAGTERGWQVVPASTLTSAPSSLDRPLLVTELDTQPLACEIKLLLLTRYSDEQPVFFFPSTAKRNRKPVEIPLWELDQQPAYDHTVCVLIPAVTDESHPLQLSDLPSIATKLTVNTSLSPAEAWRALREEALAAADCSPENAGRLLGRLMQISALLCSHGECDEDELARLAAAVMRKPED